MEITNTQAVQTATQTVSTGSGTALASDFETFLKMLTAQARYQDPLEPIDSSEYAAQLAQFSMVEQQVLSNDLLTSLGTQIGANNIGQMASWIGMEASSISPATYTGDPITVRPVIEADADEAVLVAYGPNGSEVQRRQISTNGEPVEWDGILADGSLAPDGNYTFKVESMSLGQIIGESSAETYSRITEARLQDGATLLVLNSGATVSASEVSALREQRI